MHYAPRRGERAISYRYIQLYNRGYGRSALYGEKRTTTGLAVLGRFFRLHVNVSRLNRCSSHSISLHSFLQLFPEFRVHSAFSLLLLQFRFGSLFSLFLDLLQPLFLCDVRICFTPSAPEAMPNRGPFAPVFFRFPRRDRGVGACG